ncbi:MAG: glycosyltransferase [Lacibacter sp.]
MKVLWLCSWYPSKLFPYNGDFIKRHAEAVSLYDEVTVIHLVREAKDSITEKYFIEDTRKGNLREIIVYYYSQEKKLPLLDKLVSFLKYRRIFKKIIWDYISLNGKPALVHVHTGMNAGAIAYWIKKEFSIPYVVSEHWTGFLTEATDNFNNLSFIHRSLWQRVLKESYGCIFVSEYLLGAMQKRFSFIQGIVIRNVVNTDIFFPVESGNSSPLFIHISTLNDFKRPERILEAFQIVVKEFPEAKLEIFGPEKKELVQKIEALNIKKNVNIFTEVPQIILAAHIKRADALVLYSNYETFGCVIIEANACGVPVIVSDIPVFHESVKEGVNGYFATNDNLGSLANTMLLAINKKGTLSKQSMSEYTSNHYSYKVIGKKISDWYRDVT